MNSRTLLVRMRALKLFRPKNLSYHQPHFEVARNSMVVSESLTSDTVNSQVQLKSFSNSHMPFVNKINFFSLNHMEKHKEDLLQIKNMLDEGKYIYAIQPVTDLITNLQLAKCSAPEHYQKSYDEILKVAYNYQGIYYMRNGNMDVSKLAPEAFNNALMIDSSYQEAAENLEEFKYSFGYVMPQIRK